MSYFVAFTQPRLDRISGRNYWTTFRAEFPSIQEAYAFMAEVEATDDCRHPHLVQDVDFNLWMKHSRYEVSYSYGWTSRVRGRIEQGSRLTGDIVHPRGRVWLGEDGCFRHTTTEMDDDGEMFEGFDEEMAPIPLGPVTPHVQGPHCPPLHGPGTKRCDWKAPVETRYSRWGGNDLWSQDLPCEPTWRRMPPFEEEMLLEYFRLKEFGLKPGSCDRFGYVEVE